MVNLTMHSRSYEKKIKMIPVELPKPRIKISNLETGESFFYSLTTDKKESNPCFSVIINNVRLYLHSDYVFDFTSMLKSLADTKIENFTPIITTEDCNGWFGLVSGACVDYETSEIYMIHAGGSGFIITDENGKEISRVMGAGNNNIYYSNMIQTEDRKMHCFPISSSYGKKTIDIDTKTITTSHKEVTNGCCLGADGKLYLAPMTSSSSFVRYNSADDTFERFGVLSSQNYDVGVSYNSNKVFFLCRNNYQKNAIIDIETKTIEYCSTAFSFTGKGNRAVLGVNQKIYSFPNSSTRAGIIEFDPTSKTFERFGNIFPSSADNSNACTLASDGNIYAHYNYNKTFYKLETETKTITTIPIPASAEVMQPKCVVNSKNGKLIFANGNSYDKNTVLDLRTLGTKGIISPFFNY